MEIVARWLLMKPVLQRLIRKADEEMVNEGANIIILCGGMMVFILFLILRR